MVGEKGKEVSLSSFSLTHTAQICSILFSFPHLIIDVKHTGMMSGWSVGDQNLIVHSTSCANATLHVQLLSWDLQKKVKR